MSIIDAARKKKSFAVIKNIWLKPNRIKIKVFLNTSQKIVSWKDFSYK